MGLSVSRQGSGCVPLVNLCSIPGTNSSSAYRSGFLNYLPGAGHRAPAHTGYSKNDLGAPHLGSLNYGAQNYHCTELLGREVPGGK